jgi:SNF2 family DNA or RNA helicase
MIALHAAFDGRRLVLWGESSSPDRSQGKGSGEHPFGLPAAELLRTLSSIGIEKARTDYAEVEVWLPSTRSAPIPSNPLIGQVPKVSKPRLSAWTVAGAACAGTDALDALCRVNGTDLLQPGVIAGADLAFWSAAMRFATALTARQHFLPNLIQEDDAFFARWRAAFIGRDDEHRNAFAEAMPAAARSLMPDVAPMTLLTEFIDAVVDGVVRRSAAGRRWAGDGLHERWLSALHSRDAKLTGTAAELQQLHQRVREWRRPIAATASAPFRLCFRLEEPAPDDASERWGVRYLLQSRKDPSLIIPAGSAWKKKETSSLWQHAGFQPREHLLFSLGQASRICNRVEKSLQSPAPEGFDIDSTGAHEFLATTAIALEEAGFGVMLPAWWTRKGTRTRLSAGAHIKSAFSGGSGLTLDALLEFQWQISIGGEQLTQAELRALAGLKAPLVKLRGQWVQLNSDEIQAALDFWKRKGKGQITAREAVRMALGATESAAGLAFAGVTAEGWFADLIEQLEGHTPFAELPPPEGLRATLRPYQLRGYSWLAFLQRWGLGACLADDMGLGKTIQTLTLIQRDRGAGTKAPVLLVCPTSVVGNWQKEAARFTPDLPVLVHHGLSRSRGEQFAEDASKHAIVVSSYSLLHRDFEILKEVPWSGVVLDEAQNIKNADTKQAAASRALSAGYRIALTGTPVENNVGDLWSIMEFLNPGLLGTRSEFKSSYYRPIQTARDVQASERLRMVTRPFILRRLKTDNSVISDLPEKMEGKVFCNLTKEQASLYAAVVKDSLNALEKADGIRRKGIVLATLTRLKQICNHPTQYLADNSPLPGRSGKLARLTEMIEEAISVDDRLLVFTQFAEMGNMLHRHLQETFGREALFLHGAVPKKQRDRMVERFQDEPQGPPVFILSLKAGGTGLNLTRASHVFHFDRWWNPAVENQATDRAFRIGQKKNVQVHKFVCAGTLEEKIDAMIEAKHEIASGVVGSGEAWLTELSTSQLKDLFALSRTAVVE